VYLGIPQWLTIGAEGGYFLWFCWVRGTSDGVGQSETNLATSRA